MWCVFCCVVFMMVEVFSSVVYLVFLSILCLFSSCRLLVVIRKVSFIVVVCLG